MSFNDDESIVAPQGEGGHPVPFLLGKIRMTINNKPEAPLEETEFKVLIELTGSEDRAPVDLVMVVDVSRSTNFEEDRIGRLKIAMKFVIEKLSPVDRLSVVTFSWNSRRLFPLRQMTHNSQQEIIDKGNALKAGGLTNMALGLEMALKVLNDRRLKVGRVAAIMLMSDGEQTLLFGDARRVHLDEILVYTCCLGEDSKTKVLQEITKNSTGEMFSDFQNQDDLGEVFSQCLAGLLTVVRDLSLTITPVDEESKIENVYAGNYPQTQNVDGSLTISFGELYGKEVRKVLVNLCLLATDCRKFADVLQITYTYSAGNGKRAFEGPPINVSTVRTRMAMDRVLIPKMDFEDNRLKTLKIVKEARVLADDNELEKADQRNVEQAKEFEKDPIKPLPSVVYDEIKEIIDKPCIPYYIKIAILASKSVGHAVKSSTRRT